MKLQALCLVSLVEITQYLYNIYYAIVLACLESMVKKLPFFSELYT